MGSHRKGGQWHRRLLGTLTLCLMLAGGSLWTLAAESNLIENGSFEQSRRGWFTGVAQPGTRATVDRTVAYEGSGSFLMASSGTGASTSIIQTVALPGPGTYRLGGALRTEDLAPTVTDQSGAVLSLQLYDAGGQAVGSTLAFVWAENTAGEWHPFAEYVAVPEGAAELRLTVQMRHARGSVWWDALELVPIASGFRVVGAQADVHPAGTVQLSWIMPQGTDGTELSYAIYRGERAEGLLDGSPLTIVTDQTFIDRDTLPGRTYYYQIVPMGEAEFGEPSEVVAAHVHAVTTPEEVSGPLYALWDESTGVARIEWTLGADVRAHVLKLERGVLTAHGVAWELVAELPGFSVGYADPLATDLVTPALQYRLTIVSPEGNVSSTMQTRLEGVVPRLADFLEPGVHPRLFISAAEIAALKGAAEANPALRVVLNSEIIWPAIQIPVKYASGIELPPKGVNGPHWELAKDARTAALGYAFTGNEAYAGVAREILLAYARVYKDTPLLGPADGKMTKQTRDEAVWITDMAWAYDLTWNSPLWTEEDRRLLKEDLFLEAARIIHPRGSNAWRTTLNAGVGAVAFLFNDEHWIYETIYGEEGFVYMMGEWNREDGLSWLHSISHHNANRERLTTFAEMAYRSGYDLYNVTVRGKSLKLMYDVALYHAFSNGKHPVVGHAQPTEALGFDWTFGAAYRRYKDPRYVELWRQTLRFLSMEFTVPSVFFLPALQEAEEAADLAVSFGSFAPQGYNVAGSTHFADTGMAVLRGSGIIQDGPEVAFLYKPHGVVVGHQTPDNLTIMLAGHGDHWLPGPGQYHYSQAPPEHGSWYRHTVARNGVVVDETSQYPQGTTNNIYPLDREKSSSGRLLGFMALPSLSAVRGATDTVYEGVAMERTLLVRAPYVVDRYVVEADSVHQYDWVVHINGKERAISLTETPQAGTLGTRAGYQHIDTLRIAETDGTWQASWQRDGGKLQLTMVGGESTTVYRAEGFGPALSRRPMLIARRTAASTEFLSVLELFDTEPVVTDVQAFAVDGVQGVQIVRTDAAEPDVLAWPTSVGVVQLDVGRFDGEMAFFGARDATGVRNMAVLAGNYVASAGVAVTLEYPADVAVEWTDTHYAVTQRSADEQTVRLVVEGGDTPYRVFALGVSDEMLLQGPIKVTEVAVDEAAVDGGQMLSWQAASEVVYVVAQEEPSANWLDRYVVEMLVTRREF